jgi:hypothetical protein
VKNFKVDPISEPSHSEQEIIVLFQFNQLARAAGLFSDFGDIGIVLKIIPERTALQANVERWMALERQVKRGLQNFRVDCFGQRAAQTKNADLTVRHNRRIQIRSCIELKPIVFPVNRDPALVLIHPLIVFHFSQPAPKQDSLNRKGAGFCGKRLHSYQKVLTILLV